MQNPPDGAPQLARVIAFRGRGGTEPWVTKRQLAAHLQVSPKTVDRWVAAGMPRLAAPGQRTVRFRISACESWLGAAS